MSTRSSFPWTVTLVLAGGLLLTSWGRPARADDLLLAGPHPFLKNNALSLQFLLGEGFGDSFSGRGVGLGYGYMLTGPLWLDFQANVRAAACSPYGACASASGSDVELMAGLAWRMRTDVPLVPFVRGDAGVVYLYPRSGADAVGLAVRGGIGARYYLYDWLGLGMEAAMSLGHGYFADDYRRGRTYAVFDVGLGMEWQFR